MARLPPKQDVIRALFAHSANQCAFEGCTHVLINHKHQFVSQVCHIESANAGGERYNLQSNDEERRSYDNLILLCYPHHIETNDVKEFTVERLKEIKRNHTHVNSEKYFKLNIKQLNSISHEMSKYWKDVEVLNTSEHIYQDLAMQVDVGRSFLEVMTDLKDLVELVEKFLADLSDSDCKLEQDVMHLLKKQQVNIIKFDEVKYYENPIINRHWETHNLVMPNLMLTIKIDLVHAEIKYFEEYFKINKGDQEIHQYFESLKAEFKQYAQSATHAD